MLKQVKLINNLMRPAVKKIVLPYVNSSAWFAHPEHILLALLSSQEESERHFAVKKILNEIRGEDGIGDCSVRVYKVPEINWSAPKIQNLIDWKTTPLSEPAVTTSMSADEIRECLDHPLELPDWPCHGQAIERTVKKPAKQVHRWLGLLREMAGLGQQKTAGRICPSWRPRKTTSLCFI